MTQQQDDDPPDIADDTINDAAWRRFMRMMTAWATRALKHVKVTDGDFNDVVSSALRTQQRRQREGIDPPPENTKELWELLKSCLNRKITKYRHAGGYRKNQALREGDIVSENQQIDWEQGFVDDNPTPEHVDAYVKEAMQVVFDAVEDPQLREIARLTMMSYLPAEIGEELGLSVHQVRRRLEEVRHQVERSLHQEE